MWWDWLPCSPGLRTFQLCNFVHRLTPWVKGNIPLLIVYKAGSLMNVQNHYPLLCVCVFVSTPCSSLSVRLSH